MYDNHIKPLYSWWEQAIQADENGSSKKFKNLKPFEITSTSDMSATWKMTGKGGTAKVKTFFCHCCGLTSDQIHYNNEKNCDFCSEFVENSPLWRDNWKCYHQQIINSEYKEKLESEYQHLKNELTVSLDLLEKESKIKLITHDVLEAKSDPFSIDFIPTNLEESVTFQDFLVDECIMRY